MNFLEKFEEWFDYEELRRGRLPSRYEAFLAGASLLASPDLKKELRKMADEARDL